MAGLCASTALCAESPGAPWERHVIDASSRGADGARLGDSNGDAYPDLAVPWEEGGIVRVYVNPGPAQAKTPWPVVTVGTVGSPEDAVLVDLDGDGAVDVVSCTEGKVQTVWVHWAPLGEDAYLDSTRWQTTPIPATTGCTRWMFALPMDLDGKHGIDLVVGSKDPHGQVGWLEAPAEPRAVADWRYHKLFDASWIMSLIALDLDADGDQDIALTNRKGDTRGCYWLENPGHGAELQKPWIHHLLGGHDHELMFMTLSKPLASEGPGFLMATKDGPLLILSQRPDTADWHTRRIPLPKGTGTGKGVALGDMDGDGTEDIVFSCEHSKGLFGVGWIERKSYQRWTHHDISGTEGTKFDLLELHDLDGDGDLDVITCEETENLGVIWYENP